MLLPDAYSPKEHNNKMNKINEHNNKIKKMKINYDNFFNIFTAQLRKGK